jgi:beta-glucanase (GH16 family)
VITYQNKIKILTFTVPEEFMKLFIIISVALLASACANKQTNNELSSKGWKVDFFDDFDTFNVKNWQDQMLWVNNENQCYVPDNQFNTREVSNGSLKIRVVDLGEKRACSNVNKVGENPPDTQFVAGRIASKNRQEFVKGKWTARLRVENSGQNGMFPAWWLLGSRNNEPPMQEADENICWPMIGSGEIDIFEHHSDGGPDHYAARAIKSLGYCGGGDWQSLMLVQQANLSEYHEFAVEWAGKDMVFRLDGTEIHRGIGLGEELPEPMFAILNFAKIKPGPMNFNWVMEVDWVKHEYR